MSDGAEWSHQRSGSRGMSRASRGVWTFTADVDLVRRLAGVGFDWLALDAQHGPVDRAALHALGRALGDLDANFVVRVPGVDVGWIGAALDSGASAVIVPSVAGMVDAEIAVRAARYPPAGERSWGPFPAMWGGTFPDPEPANRSAQCVIMVETVGALAEVHAIATLPGVDALFIGPFDLALGLGRSVTDLLDDDSDGNPIDAIVMAAREAEIMVAAFAGNAENAKRLREREVHCLAITTDLAIVEHGSRAALEADRAVLGTTSLQ
jgi:4-hydroxy-2-oxoheptanedioate aldolase